MKSRRVDVSSTSTSRLIDTQVSRYQSDVSRDEHLVVDDQFEKPGTGLLHGIRMKLKPEYREHQHDLRRKALAIDHARQEREIELEDKQEEQKRFDDRIAYWNKLSDEEKEAYDAFSRQVSSTGKGISRLKEINEAIRAGWPIEIPRG